MRHLSLALVIAAAALCNVNADEVYKWKDKNGVVHYGEFEPQNRKSTTIETPTSKPDVAVDEATGDETQTAIDQVAPQEGSVEKKKKMLENINEERAKKNEAKAKAASNAQANQERCDSLKSRLAVLERGGRFSEGRPDGKVHYLTEDEIKARIAETSKSIAKDCKK